MIAAEDVGAALGAKLDAPDLSDAEQAPLHGLLTDAADVEVAGFSSGFAGMLTGMSFTRPGGARPLPNSTSTNPSGQGPGVR